MGLTLTAMCRVGCVCHICHLGHKCVTRNCFFSGVTARKWGNPGQNLLCFSMLRVAGACLESTFTPIISHLQIHSSSL